ncbi:MAG: endonuclease MutS2 [Kiritimatiellae bacterium]|nr:endonuclease MutS2 [Kiritimatiellia bacterium]
MNKHSLKVLEFERVLELIAAHASSGPGQEYIRHLPPDWGPEHLARLQALFSEFLSLRRQGGSLPSADFEDPEQALITAAPARAVLAADGFAVIRRILRMAAEVRRRLVREAGRDLPKIRELAERLDPCYELLRAIEETFDENCKHVRDTASERLRKIRTKILALEKSITLRLESMLRDPALAGVFQEDFVAVRHGRHVLTVKREARHRIRGIVHDQSNSGMTLYIEPESVIEVGNELECLRLDERDEVHRVLGTLTDRVRERIDTIRRNFETLQLYDTAYAVSAWAVRYGCTIPAWGENLRLVAARHPLLQHRLETEGRGTELVPLDLEVPPGKNVILITGSNTGGKTVALKTIGLLTMMAHAGLPVPAAAGTTIPSFADILSDIGDEQSIEQSLSTFSAHLGNIVETLAAAGKAPCLVLLDELGAGTDPLEGGALASAILDALSKTAGLTFATTHLGAVKRFVHAHPRMENASMLFDLETLRPLYRLVMGHPGASYALAIAARRGVPADVLRTAQNLMEDGDLRLENMLAAMDQKQIRLDREIDELERAREEARKSRERAAAERDRVRAELEDLRRTRRELVRQAREEAAALLAGVRREAEQILSRLHKNPPSEQVRELRNTLRQREEKLREALTEPGVANEERADKLTLVTGMRVWVDSLRDHGIVKAIGPHKDRVTVEVAGMRIEVDRKDLAEARQGQETRKERRAVVHGAVARSEVLTELNLVGQRVEVALRNLERFLNSAVLAGVNEVRIVHGHGSGALRRAVQDYLQRAGIGTFRLGETGRDPGGTGVTIVTL